MHRLHTKIIAVQKHQVSLLSKMNINSRRFETKNGWLQSST